MAKNLFDTEKGKQLIEDMKNRKFQAEEDEEYIKELEKTLQDEEKKRKIYVNILFEIQISTKFFFFFTFNI